MLLAGVFATAMGSLSTALNALATSLTNDWYIPYFAKESDAHHHVAAARWFTVLFAILMILIAGVFAYAKVTNPVRAHHSRRAGDRRLYPGPDARRLPDRHAHPQREARTQAT